MEVVRRNAGLMTSLYVMLLFDIFFWEKFAYSLVNVATLVDSHRRKRLNTKTQMFERCVSLFSRV